MPKDIYRGKVNVLHLLEGSRHAQGTAVIIDVFRAFSLECYLYALGARTIRPVGSLEEAYRLKRQYPDCLLVGERQGKMCEGFDFGNSPCSIREDAVRGKAVIHTTSAGTQGIINARQADVILTGSLVNARAIAEYILRQDPPEVSLVCMGNGGVRPAAEDELCAAYIRSLLKGEEFPDLKQRIADLRHRGGEHFFVPETQDVYPEPDFWLCILRDRFDFVLKVEKDELGFAARKIDGLR